MDIERESPTVSVVIPAYNAAHTLASTLESVICQLEAKDEVVLVDDGSTDNTADVIASLCDSRIRYIYQTNSGGPARPRNRGVDEAAGDVILFFDSDDVMIPGKIRAAKEAFLANTDAGLIFTNFMTIDDEGNVLKRRFLDDYDFTKNYASYTGSVRFEAPSACRALASENFVGTSGVAIPKSVLARVGKFDESLSNGDDRDMWFRLTRRYPAVYLPKAYHCYRIGRSSISSGSAHKRTPAKLKVLERQLSDPLDTKFARDIKELIADNYHTLAYESFSTGQMEQCRAEIAKGWHASKRIVWVKLWIYSLLGVHLSGALRKIKRALIR